MSKLLDKMSDSELMKVVYAIHIITLITETSFILVFVFFHYTNNFIGLPSIITFIVCIVIIISNLLSMMTYKAKKRGDLEALFGGLLIQSSGFFIILILIFIEIIL
ncbi:hypothetical protein [uncultured Desulfovibrio sp.]|uniref:hypothetical protein n=1 Tax=uncultured Desulfovibrio sp. TaxID=167968 RepID=UPI0025847600|nr:hypothetical protein [uncultured Desulfovibrio sp.]